MKFTISWLVFLNVKNENKADKLITQLSSSITLEVKNLKYEPYWKEPKWIKAEFTTPYHEEMNFQEAVFNTLQAVNNIGYQWSVFSPRNNINNDNSQMVCNFEGICTNPRITGIEWAQFVLQTDTKIEYGWNH
ncbi:hypothetical protein [Paenibacillus sp. LPE1-1-1.1]|uniref:hypothetical protein n=1 Tax=Paenibacillus sp. LPE1-1-1.1 TaxID=3135230 RepID=UPI003439AEC9